MNGLVLVVDDEQRNRILARQLLEKQGYTVEEADNGARGVEAARSLGPDLILLDVMMPEMDGFEACRQLKNSPETAAIPVLIVSALKERDDRMKGIEAGADDFLTKPINAHEMVLRVRNAVRGKQLYDRLDESYQKLREAEKLRDELTHMLAHDMRAPLTAVIVNLEMLQCAEALGPRQHKRLEQALRQSDALVSMIDSMLDVSRLEADRMPLSLEECDLNQVAEEALTAVYRATRVRLEKAALPVRATADPAVVERVIQNLVRNALKYAPDDEVRVVVSEGPRVEVLDKGPGVSPEHRERIFEKFGRVGPGGREARRSTGLGLTFCKMAVELHGGRIGVEDLPGGGSRFWFTLGCA